jgi:O-antigen/teichoic acid export membrane protein
MAAIQLLVTALRGVWLIGLSRRVYGALRVELGLADRQFVRLIFSFSVFSFLIHISGRVIYYTDAIIIGSFLPIGMLTFFSIGGSLVEHARSLISSISYTTSPLASSLDAVGKNEHVQRVLLETGRFSTMILLPIAVTFLIRGESFIRLWMGPAYASGAGEVLAILTLPLFLHAGTHGLGGIMMGVGKHKPMVVAMIIEGAANLALSLALVGSQGIAGVAWGTTIPSLASSLLFWPWYLQRALGIRPGRYFGTIWARPLLALIPFAVCTYLTERLWPAETLLGFAMQVALCVLLIVATDWWLCFSRRQRDEIVAAVRRRIGLTPAQASAG